MSAQLLILSAPSGAGKTSLAKALVSDLAPAKLSVSHTTRERRPGEEHGRDYYFVSGKEFEDMKEQDAFLEYAQVFDHWYGTARRPVEQAVAQGNLVVLDIDWQGARKVREKLPNALSIFILPPSLEALETRLRNRRQDADAIIQRRMRDAVAEMKHYQEYDYIVNNDDFDAALGDIKAYVEGRKNDVRPANVDVSTLIDANRYAKVTE